MTDRDLIAEARNMAAVFTDHVTFGVTGKDMMRRLLRDLADALEAAQRPPLGYVAMARRAESVRVVGPVWPDDVRAKGTRARMSGDAEKHPAFWGGAVFVVAEVREVQL